MMNQHFVMSLEEFYNAYVLRILVVGMKFLVTPIQNLSLFGRVLV
jgi:hypothetical protein